jgi:hypothetical protein
VGLSGYRVVTSSLREGLPEEKGEFTFELATEDKGTLFDAELGALNRLKKNGRPNK